MYKKYQDGLIQAIKNNTDINAQDYFGELERPEEGAFAKGALPAVYIDFVEDDTSNPSTIEIFFSLYIVHISYSKNTQTRLETKQEIYDLLGSIYNNIAFKSIEDSEPLRLKKLQKIFDAKAAGGYLTVYKKDLSMHIPNPLITGGY